jgi:hypothetical protein
MMVFSYVAFILCATYIYSLFLKHEFTKQTWKQHEFEEVWNHLKETNQNVEDVAKDLVEQKKKIDALTLRAGFKL